MMENKYEDCCEVLIKQGSHLENREPVICGKGQQGGCIIVNTKNAKTDRAEAASHLSGGWELA
jgi:hypothetical protein